MKSKEEILSNMAQATGTEGYHRFSILFRKTVLTDGVMQLCKDAECFWLMDIIGSYQHKLLPKEDFQVWTHTVNSGAISGVVVATDGNDKELVRQELEYTSFPLDEIKLFVQYNGELQVIMLPNEY